MSSQGEDDVLTSREGFLAMAEFLERFYDRAGDDMATLLTDLQIQGDGGPLDPAAWTDWLAAIEHVRAEGK